jgi:hypothetical protein
MRAFAVAEAGRTVAVLAAELAGRWKRLLVGDAPAAHVPPAAAYVGVWPVELNLGGTVDPPVWAGAAVGAVA